MFLSLVREVRLGSQEKSCMRKSFIQRWIKKKTEKLNCFHVVVDLKSSLKDDIGNATDDTFNADELACCKLLIDHLVRIEKALKNSHNH